MAGSNVLRDILSIKADLTKNSENIADLNGKKRRSVLQLNQGVAEMTREYENKRDPKNKAGDTTDEALQEAVKHIQERHDTLTTCVNDMQRIDEELGNLHVTRESLLQEVVNLRQSQGKEQWCETSLPNTSEPERRCLQILESDSADLIT